MVTAGQDHEPAVGRPHNCDALRVCPTRGPEPGVGRFQVGDAVHPLAHVVQMVIGPAVARAAPDVGRQHHVTPVGEVLEHRLEHLPCLRRRTPVDLYDGGVAAVGFRVPGSVQDARYLQTVQRWEPHDL